MSRNANIVPPAWDKSGKGRSKPTRQTGLICPAPEAPAEIYANSRVILPVQELPCAAVIFPVRSLALPVCEPATF